MRHVCEGSLDVHAQAAKEYRMMAKHGDCKAMRLLGLSQSLQLARHKRTRTHTHTHTCTHTYTHTRRATRTTTHARSDGGHAGSPLPRLHRDRAHPCHICTGTELTPATTSAICTGTALLQIHVRPRRPEGRGQGVRVVLARRRERYGGSVSLYHRRALLASCVPYRPSKRSTSRSARPVCSISMSW